MSALEQIRDQLASLMGTSRNGDDRERGSVKFSSPNVCKAFLLDACPNEILKATRMDLGECAKIHDLALRADYEMASKSKDYFYDVDALEHLESFVSDCDRRTEQAKKRLLETQEDVSMEVSGKANSVHEIAEELGKKMAKAESLGEAGQVEESLLLMTEIDELREKKQRAEQEYKQSVPASSYQLQKLRVCDVCSAYLGLHDDSSRLADHFGGKLHMGFIEIREKFAKLEKTAGPRRSQRSNNYRGGNSREADNRRNYCGGRELDRRSRMHRDNSSRNSRRSPRRYSRSRSPKRSRSRSPSRSSSSYNSRRQRR